MRFLWDVGDFFKRSPLGRESVTINQFKAYTTITDKNKCKP